MATGSAINATCTGLPRSTPTALCNASTAESYSPFNVLASRSRLNWVLTPSVPGFEGCASMQATIQVLNKRLATANGPGTNGLYVVPHDSPQP